MDPPTLTQCEAKCHPDKRRGGVVLRPGLCRARRREVSGKRPWPISGKLIEPVIEDQMLLGRHLAEKNAHSGDSKPAAGVLVDHSAFQLAGAERVGDGEVKYGADRERFERIDVAAAAADLA